MEGSTTTKWLGGVLVHAVVTPGVALFSNDLPPPSLEDLAARIAPLARVLVYATPGQAASPSSTTSSDGRARAQGHLGRAGRRAYRWHRGRARSTSGASSGSSTAPARRARRSPAAPIRLGSTGPPQHALVDVADEGAVLGGRLALHLGPLLVGSQPSHPLAIASVSATRAGRRTRSADRCSSPRPRGCGIRGAP